MWTPSAQISPLASIDNSANLASYFPICDKVLALYQVRGGLCYTLLLHFATSEKNGIFVNLSGQPKNSGCSHNGSCSADSLHFLSLLLQLPELQLISVACIPLVPFFQLSVLKVLTSTAGLTDTANDTKDCPSDIRFSKGICFFAFVV